MSVTVVDRRAGALETLSFFKEGEFFWYDGMLYLMLQRRNAVCTVQAMGTPLPDRTELKSGTRVGPVDIQIIVT